MLTEHEKLARWSCGVSVHVSLPTVLPNLTVGGVTSDRPPAVSLRAVAPLRYHVTEGAGLPPSDVHVSSTVSPSRLCSTPGSSRGTPALTESHSTHTPATASSAVAVRPTAGQDKMCCCFFFFFLFRYGVGELLSTAAISTGLFY